MDFASFNKRGFHVVAGVSSLTVLIVFDFHIEFLKKVNFEYSRIYCEPS